MRTLDDVMATLPKERADKIYADAQATIFELELAQLRKKSGISQSELAKKLHISQSAISQIESAKNLQLDTLANYVQALGGRLKLSIEMNGV